MYEFQFGMFIANTIVVNKYWEKVFLVLVYFEIPSCWNRSINNMFYNCYADEVCCANS